MIFEDECNNFESDIEVQGKNQVKKNIKRERRKIKGNKKIFHGKKPKYTGRHTKLMNFKDRAQIFFRTKILRERIFKIKGTTKYIKENHRNQNVKPQ